MCSKYFQHRHIRDVWLWVTEIKVGNLLGAVEDGDWAKKKHRQLDGLECPPHDVPLRHGQLNGWKLWGWPWFSRTMGCPMFTHTLPVDSFFPFLWSLLSFFCVYWGKSSHTIKMYFSRLYNSLVFSIFKKLLSLLSNSRTLSSPRKKLSAHRICPHSSLLWPSWQPLIYFSVWVCLLSIFSINKSYNLWSLLSISFIFYNVSKIHPCYIVCQYCVLFLLSIIFLYTHTQDFVFHSSVDRLLRLLQLLAIMNNATVNIHEWTCWGICVQFSRNRIVGSIFKKLPNFSKVSALFYSVTSNIWEWQVFHIFINTCYFPLFYL